MQMALGRIINITEGTLEQKDKNMGLVVRKIKGLNQLCHLLALSPG